MLEEVLDKPDFLEQVLATRAGTLPRFLIYAPENSALRTFQAEGQILPLGVRGEGLFAHLKALNTEIHRARLMTIKDRLRLIDWFETFDIPDDLSPGERSIRIRDRYLPDGTQSSTSEVQTKGSLFLLFYMTLFISPDTPAFFSIDKHRRVPSNPKLCITLMQQLTSLAKEYDKQVILTTHNPAVLDGLNLHDDDPHHRSALRVDIDGEFYKIDGHRILFAVAVDSIECWLLPLLHTTTTKPGRLPG